MTIKNDEKRNHIAVALFLLISITLSCTEEEPLMSISDKQGKMLAGDLNQYKKWKLVSGESVYSDDPQTTAELDFDACFLDNEYVFYNGEDQKYENNEGGSKCNVIDPALIESGFWAFSRDGEILLISANDLFNVDESIFGKFGSPPASVLELTENQLIIEYNYTQTGYATGIFRFTFQAMN